MFLKCPFLLLKSSRWVLLASVCVCVCVGWLLLFRVPQCDSNPSTHLPFSVNVLIIRVANERKTERKLMRGGGESPPSLPASLFPPFFPSFYLTIPVCSGKSLFISPSFWLFSPLMFLPSCLSPPNFVYIARPQFAYFKDFHP